MTAFRVSDEPIDERLDRLEASVRAGRVERVMSMLKFGLNALFIFVGVSGLVVATAYLNERVAAAETARAELATAATEEARSHCAEACEANEMSLARVRNAGAVATACVCVAPPHTRVVLWNDDPPSEDRTPEQRAYDRCDAACVRAGRTYMHALVVCAHRDASTIGDVCDEYATQACFCHGTTTPLWDTRP